MRRIVLAIAATLLLSSVASAQYPYYGYQYNYGYYPQPNYAYSFGTTYRYVPNVGYRARVTPFVYPPYPVQPVAPVYGWGW